MDATLVEPTASAEAINALTARVDTLTEQVSFLVEEALAQRSARREWQDLQQDLTPVTTELFQTAVVQMAELEHHVQLEDVLHLFKRLLRNTRNLEQMLDQLESAVELGRDISPLSQDAFVTMLTRLDEFERKGYFNFARGGMRMADKVVSNFDEDDVNQLGDNVVLILETVKEMTQPEIMTMMRSTAHMMREQEPQDTSLRGLLRQMRDPAVRRGLAKMMMIMQSLGTAEATENNSGEK